MAQHVAGNVNFAATGQVNNRRTETPREQKTEKAKEGAEAESKSDLRAKEEAPGAEGANQQTRVVRKKVRRRRVDAGQTQSSWGGGKTENSKQTQKGQKNAQTAHTGPGSHMLRGKMTGQSSLVRASVLYQNNSAQNAQQGQPSNFATRQNMLKGLSNYISNDYAMMKANPDDKAFTYRTAEARVLNSTINQMVAASAKPSGGSKSKDGESGSKTEDSRLSPEAFGRQKGLLRKLVSMSEPNQSLPEGLPPDYRPFEGVA